MYCVRQKGVMYIIWEQIRIIQELLVVRNHDKLLRVINSRRGFSKGTVLYGGY